MVGQLTGVPVASRRRPVRGGDERAPTNAPVVRAPTTTTSSPDAAAVGAGGSGTSVLTTHALGTGTGTSTSPTAGPVVTTTTITVAPTTTTTTTTTGAGSAVPADRTQTQGYLNPPLQTSNGYGFTGTGAMQVSVLWSGNTYLTMEVSCPSGEPERRRHLRHGGIAPRRERQLPGHGERAGAGEHVADLHDHDRPRRWLGGAERRRVSGPRCRRRRGRGPLAFSAVPAVLVLVVGNPLAGGLGHAWRPVRRDALCVLALAAWVAWAACCAQLVRAVVVHVRRGDVGPQGDASVVDRLARGSPFGYWRSRASAHPSSSRRAPAPACPPRTSPRAPWPPPGSGRTGARRPRSPAARDLRGAAGRHAVEHRGRAARRRGGLDGARRAQPRPRHARRRAVRRPRPPPGRLAPACSPGTPVRPASCPIEAGRTSTRPRRARATCPNSLRSVLGSLACAALARRARRRRQGNPFAGDLDLGPRSEGAVDAAVLLRRFEGVPALSSFEAANRLLGWSLQDRPGGPANDPAARAICVSPSGVTFWLAAPRTDAPDGFVPVMGGNGWHVDHEALDVRGVVLPAVSRRVPCR